VAQVGTLGTSYFASNPPTAANIASGGFGAEPPADQRKPPVSTHAGRCPLPPATSASGHHAKSVELMPSVCFAVRKRAFEWGTQRQIWTTMILSGASWCGFSIGPPAASHGGHCGGAAWRASSAIAGSRLPSRPFELPRCARPLAAHQLVVDYVELKQGGMQ